jgi:hypothetical protein
MLTKKQRLDMIKQVELATANKAVINYLINFIQELQTENTNLLIDKVSLHPIKFWSRAKIELKRRNNRRFIKELKTIYDAKFLEYVSKPVVQEQILDNLIITQTSNELEKDTKNV